MKSLGNLFANLFGGHHTNTEGNSRADIYREWDRQRARAMSPSERSEIDAIFSRSV